MPDGSDSTAAGTASTGMVHTEAARRGSEEEAARRGPGEEEAAHTEPACRKPEEAAGGYMVIYRGTRYSLAPLLWGRG